MITSTETLQDVELDEDGLLKQNVCIISAQGTTILDSFVYACAYIFCKRHESCD